LRAAAGELVFEPTAHSFDELAVVKEITATWAAKLARLLEDANAEL
jgi:hypothetical protein